MAKKRGRSYGKSVYREALEFMGIDTKKGWSLKTMKQKWSDLRKQQTQEGVELPNVRTVAKTAKEYEYEQTPRDEQMNTLPPDEPIDKGTEYIESFLATIDQIYQDTKSRIATAPKNDRGNVKDPEFYFLEKAEPMMEESYREIKRMLASMRSQFGDDIVAQAIAKDKEIDYTQALVFMPPSDTMNNFEATVEQLTAVMRDISSTMAW